MEEKDFNSIKHKLKATERVLLEELYGFNFINPKKKTKKELADMFGISKSYISRVEERAIKFLQEEKNM